MEKSENESDSSGDYMDATDDPFSYSVENTLSNVTIPEINKMLVERMNPDFGILDKLLASKALSRAEIAEVGRLSTFHEQNIRLLELVTKNGKLTELCNALKDTRQEHLVNYVTAKGEYSLDYGGAWPLTERETSILDANQEALVDLLDFTGDEIINKLYEVKALNGRQKEFICKQLYNYKKAQVLLDFLYRSSMSDYWKVITCLRGTNQQRVAKILFDGGALVRVHNAVTGDTEVVTTAEKEIVERIDSMLSNMDLEESSRVLERLQLKLFAVRAGHSINLYILCETVDELMHLSNLLTSGELQKGIERFFNQLIVRSETVHVFSTVSQETLEKCKMFLEVDRSQKNVSSKDILKLCEQMKVEEERRTEEEQEEQPMEGVGAKGEFEKSSNEDDRTATSNTAMNDLPLELLDMILRKVYRHSCVIGNRLGPSTDEEIVRNMASVDYCWFQRVTRRKFKSNIWRNLKGFYTKFYKRIVICRNTRLYLVENIQTKGMFEMFEKLRSVDCLTDIQTRLVNRGEDRRLVQKGKDTSRRLSGNMKELLHLAKSLDDSRYSAFVQCLLENKQNLCARVASSGGVVIRADIQTSNFENRKSVEQQMVKAVSYLRDRTRSKPPPLERQLKRLKADNIEIFNFLLDRNPVVWFWCHTKSGLAKLEKDSDLVLKLFNLQSIARPSEIVEVKSVNIDSDRFRKQFADELEFFERLCIKGNVRVRGLTQLRNYVYALCRSYSSSPNSIQVFADQHPFPLRHKISIDYITEPEDIGSNEAENCLYVTDSATDMCIWKISTSDYQPTKWLTGASDEPFTVSLSIDGQLLKMRKSHPVSSLVIYGADSVLRGTYQMPADIHNPQHAVKTSSGTFVVLHELWQDKVDANDPRGGQLWTVSELARDAQMTIRRFDPKGSEQQLDRPTYLGLDSDEQVFILDTWAERVVLLDSELKWKRVLTKTGDTLSSPLWSLRAHYNALNHRLMVAGLAAVDFYTEDMPNLREEPQFQAAASMELGHQELGKRKGEMYGITADTIRKHKDLLKDRLQDTEFGILGKLLANDGLTYQEATAIETCSTNPYDRSKKLIDVVLEKNIVSEFIKALVDTEQKHLVNYLRGDGDEMYEMHWITAELIQKHKELLKERLDDTTFGILDMLLDNGGLTQKEMTAIENCSTNPVVRSKELIMAVLKKNIVPKLIQALEYTNQTHLVNYMRGDAVSSDVFRINLERHRVFVEGRMDPDNGLVDRLQETDAIDYSEVRIISAKKVPFKKNRKILDIVLEGNASEKIKKFCEALTYTKQQHLVNYVEANGVYKTEFVGNWPLGEREINIIDKNVSFLRQRIETAHGLLADMRKHNTITMWQEKRVSEQPGHYERNSALLDIIRRGSLSEYKNTIDRLVETKQEHIAKILIEGGAVLQIHSSATGKVPIIKQGEAAIVTQLLNVMQEKTKKEQTRLLELAQLINLGLIDAVVIESIGLFFHCKHLSDFLRLLELLKSKELQRMVETIYNKFISTSTKIEVTLTWSNDEINRVKRDLEEMESAHPKSQVALLSVYQLWHLIAGRTVPYSAKFFGREMDFSDGFNHNCGVDHSQEQVFGKDILKLCEKTKVVDELGTGKQEQDEELVDVAAGQKYRTGEEVTAEEEKIMKVGGSRSGDEEMRDELYIAELNVDETEEEQRVAVQNLHLGRVSHSISVQRPPKSTISASDTSATIQSDLLCCGVLHSAAFIPALQCYMNKGL